jgi:aspartate carbamoyltransferase regulatory subunit
MKEANIKEDKTRKVDLIEEGIVIDHLPARSALKVISVLCVDEGDSVVTIGVNFKSKTLGRKDVVKIENKQLSEDELNKIALIAPKATISIIKGFKVIKKVVVKIPDTFIDIIRCRNPNCITNHQPVITKFITQKKDPLKIKCVYCEKSVSEKSVTLL